MFFLIKGYQSNPNKFVKTYEINQHHKARKIITYQKSWLVGSNYGEKLKNAHLKILDTLTQIPSSSLSFAYKKGKCCKDALQVHIGSQLFIKCDIRHFFESIHYQQFIEVTHPLLKMHKVDAKKLKLCFYKDTLPIGFVSSPKMSDLYLHYFDCLMEKYIQHYSFLRYSRYCDDILISTPLNDLTILQRFYDYLVEELKCLNLNINEEKTRIVDLNKSTSVTFLGLNLCKKGQTSYISLSKKYILKSLKMQSKINTLQLEIERLQGSFYNDEETIKQINKMKYFVSYYQMVMDSTVAYIKNNSDSAYQRFLKKYRNYFSKEYNR